jgi:hypothetical protein
MSPRIGRARPGQEARSNAGNSDKHIVSRRTLFIEYESEWRVNVRGASSWQLCEQAGGRRPIWSNATKSWVLSAATARKVVELAAEAGDLDIVMTGPRMAGVKQVYAPEQGSLW